MPYTDPTWDPEVPADGDLLSQGDDVIRAEKLDIKERVESFFKSIDGDPWVPKDKSIPAGALADGAVTVDALDPALNLRSIILTTVAWSGTIAAGAFVLNSFTVTGAEPGDFIRDHTRAGAPVRFIGVRSHGEMRAGCVRGGQARHVHAVRFQRPEQRRLYFARMIAPAFAVLVESRLVGLEVG